STASLAIDYSVGGAYTKRVMLGLGLPARARPGHPPGWGTGGDKPELHDNIAAAQNGPQRIQFSPSQYAPADWDGRIWLSLILHNVGAGKSLSVQFVDANQDAPPEPDEQVKWRIVRNHQTAFLRGAYEAMGEESPQ